MHSIQRRHIVPTDGTAPRRESHSVTSILQIWRRLRWTIPANGVPRPWQNLKSYVCVFVCLATKAIHLELVSDLSAVAFISAFRRFVSRRGHCDLLWSDNATNFRGADAELRSMLKEASTFYREVAPFLANAGTTWRFIPPSAPHFGGIWEAGVKSMKYHLKRVVGERILTYDELSTLLCQVEAYLNSRPLHPLSTDPFDLSALTPGHMLVGEPLVNIPERSYEEFKDEHPLSRWQHVSRMRDHLWRR